MSNRRQEWTDAIKSIELAAMKKRSKYGAVKITVDGITFDSKKEAQRYHELKLMEKAGEIRNLQLQPAYRLNTWHGDHSVAPLVGWYRADFRYELRVRIPLTIPDLWSVVVEDVKGFKTPLYIWKKKHVEAQYGIKIREV